MHEKYFFSFKFFLSNLILHLNGLISARAWIFKMLTIWQKYSAVRPLGVVSVNLRNCRSSQMTVSCIYSKKHSSIKYHHQVMIKVINTSILIGIWMVNVNTFAIKINISLYTFKLNHADVIFRYWLNILWIFNDITNGIGVPFHRFN